MCGWPVWGAQSAICSHGTLSISCQVAGGSPAGARARAPEAELEGEAPVPPCDPVSRPAISIRFLNQVGATPAAPLPRGQPRPWPHPRGCYLLRLHPQPTPGVQFDSWGATHGLHRRGCPCALALCRPTGTARRTPSTWCTPSSRRCTPADAGIRSRGPRSTPAPATRTQRLGELVIPDDVSCSQPLGWRRSGRVCCWQAVVATPGLHCMLTGPSSPCPHPGTAR